MTKQQFRIIAYGLLPDGVDVAKLSPTARAEIRAALDVLLELAAATENKTKTEG